MIGWLGDFFRFWWALFYWNTRKTWFRLRGAHRDSCPCQTFSDSGLALDSRCEAVVHWHRPGRFRRVCPLLTETADGWRCGVNAESVRPFWGRASLYGALGFVGVYVVATGLAFAAFQALDYDLRYRTIALPTHWHEIRQAQEKLYATRASRAMASGQYQEAILALERVCSLNPQNRQAALALANLAQVASHADLADLTYERLYRDMPEHRIATAQIWFRALLARGAYDRIKPLAVAMITEDVSERGVWFNALLFSARATRDSEILVAALNHRNALPGWCTEILEIERDLLGGRSPEALPRLLRVHRQPEVAYLPFFQVDRLIRTGRLDDAQTVLGQYAPQLVAEETGLLRLRIFQARQRTGPLTSEYETVLPNRLAPRSAARLCSHLLTNPDPTLAARYGAHFERDFPEPAAESLALFHASYLVATLNGDTALAERLLAKTRRFTNSDSRALTSLASLLPLRGPDARVTRIMPLVPLPVEVIYAVLERQQPPPAP